MSKFYSPKGNFEVWDKKPEGYFTEEEWKQLHPEPVYVPTKEEKLAQLDAQYDNDIQQLSSYFTEAQLEGDTELQTELQAELQQVKAEYTSARNAIIEEEE